MDFIYLDPGLYGYAGHHASFCRHLTQALKKRGHNVSIYANVYMANDLRQDLNLLPLFRANPYAPYLPEHEKEFDPICGWLKAFELIWQATFEDLTRLQPPGPDAVIYWNSAFPAQLVALAQWLKMLPTGTQPRAIVELNIDSGIIVNRDAQGRETFEVPDPRVHDRPMLWRYAAMLLNDPKLKDRIKLINFEPSTVAGYEFLMRQPVEAWEPPFASEAPVESRVGKRAFAVGILGYQREEKGFTLVPQLAEQLLAERQDIALLVHNSDPSFLATTQQEMRQLAARQNRLVLREGPLKPKNWAEMLACCDLILCPYDPVSFETRCSGMLNEALANAIPVIVPANTSLSRMFHDFGGPGATFAKWRPDSIAQAVHSVLNSYDKHAEQAFRASERWKRENSVETLRDRVLEWAAQGQCESLAAIG